MNAEHHKRLVPSKSYIAKAVPANGGFHALFSAPGLLPRLVGAHAAPQVFTSPAAAEIAAMRALYGILNEPRQQQARGKDMRYQKLSGPEFAVLLAETGIGLTLFAHLYGTSPDRVQSWIDGVDSPPHPARILLELFKRQPVLVDIAEGVTEAVTTERRPRGP